MLDIGVGQQEEVRIQLQRLLDTLLHCPQLARPSWRLRTPGDHGDAIRNGILSHPFAQPSRRVPRAGLVGGPGPAKGWGTRGDSIRGTSGVGCPVSAVVVNHENVKVGFALAEERRDRSADYACFVARRNDHGDAQTYRFGWRKSRFLDCVRPLRGPTSLGMTKWKSETNLPEVTMAEQQIQPCRDADASGDQRKEIHQD